jgi:hypothetical protein
MTTFDTPDDSNTVMEQEQVSDEQVSDGTNGHGPETATPLLTPEDSAAFEQRWTEVQTYFVDDPERAVEDADRLVGDLMEALATRFADQKRSLTAQWSSGDAVETEDLRIALTRYRDFFRRLLAA